MTNNPASPRKAAAFALYVILIIIFYSPVVFGGRSLNPSLYTPHGFTAGGSYDSASRTPVNSFNVDIASGAFYEFPLNKLIGDSYKSGSVPLWNPYQAGGTPLAAQYSTKAFFPYQILEDISPPPMWDLFILGRFLVAGFFTFLFLSSMGLSFAPAFAGGLFYMFSGSFTWFTSLEELTNTAMCLPVVLYCLERLAKPPLDGAPPRWSSIFSLETALAGVSIAMMLLAGQPEVALYGSALAAVYFFLRVIKLRGLGSVHIEFVRFSLSYLIALGLAAPLLLIFIEFVGESHHIHPAGSTIALEKLHSWKAIFAYLTPTVTEFPADPEMISGTSLLVKLKEGWYRFLPLNGVWDTLGGYTGAVPVLAAAAGAVLTLTKRAARAYRAELLCFFIFALVILLKNTGVVPFVWLGKLPLFDRVWSLRWAGPSLMLAVSVAGAIGLETLRSATSDEPPPGPSKRGLVLSGAVAPATTVLLSIALFIGLYLFISFVPAVFVTLGRGAVFNASMAPFVKPSILYGSMVTLAVMCGFLIIIFTRLNRRVRGWVDGFELSESGWVWAVIALSAVELWWAVPRGYGPEQLGYKWIPFAIGIAVVALAYVGRRYAVGAVMLIFLIASFALDESSPRGFPDRTDPYAAPPYVEFLKKQPGNYRVIGSYGALFPNYASTVGVADLRYVNSLLPYAYHLYRSNYLHATEYNEDLASTLWFTGRPERIITDLTIQDPALRFSIRPREVEDDILNRLADYSFMGVKYFVMPSDIDTALSMVYNVEERRPYFNVVYDEEVTIYENPNVSARSFMVYGYESAETLKGAQESAFGSSFDFTKRAVLEGEPPAAGEAGEYRSSIIEYTPGSVSIDVETSRDGMLVLTDVYYPGWRVEVNGQEAELRRVNGLVRGVALKKGRSSVEFSYRPKGFRTGVIILLLTGVFCVVISYPFARKG